MYILMSKQSNKLLTNFRKLLCTLVYTCVIISVVIHFVF
nr:MAG TPA: hypothetical protein [Caudoviricetes sp.]